jgi:hypothetical protein
MYILWPFGTVCGHLVNFLGFGMLYQEKSGNPELGNILGESSTNSSGRPVLREPPKFSYYFVFSSFLGLPLSATVISGFDRLIKVRGGGRENAHQRFWAGGGWGPRFEWDVQIGSLYLLPIILTVYVALA